MSILFSGLALKDADIVELCRHPGIAPVFLPCAQPMVAKKQGNRYAGGMGRAAAESVNFSLRETKPGLIPATISPCVIKTMSGNAAPCRQHNSPHAFKEAQRLLREAAGQPMTLALIADTAGRVTDIRAPTRSRRQMWPHPRREREASRRQFEVWGSA